MKPIRIEVKLYYTKDESEFNTQGLNIKVGKKIEDFFKKLGYPLHDHLFVASFTWEEYNFYPK